MKNKIEYNYQPTIFLDIDGVLATEKSQRAAQELWYNKRTYPFDKKCVTAFNKIIETRNPQIVLSSDWRRSFDLEELDEIFKFNKVLKSPEDYTRMLHDRDLEIKDYVVKHKLSKFVIIDDMELTIYKERFVRTNLDKGLQLVHVKQILKLLK